MEVFWNLWLFSMAIALGACSFKLYLNTVEFGFFKAFINFLFHLAILPLTPLLLGVYLTTLAELKALEIKPS